MLVNSEPQENPPPSKLDLLLEGLGEVESTGTFTLAADRAIEKLAKFQLPDPRIWLVKIYQAAHCAEVERLTIEGGLRGLSIEFPLPEDWTYSKLEEALLSPHISKEPELANLVIGLRSAVLSQYMTLRLSCRKNDGPTSGFVFNSQSLKQLEDTEEISENTLQLVFRRSVNLQTWKKEKAFLLKRASSPMALWVDGESRNPKRVPYNSDGVPFQSVKSSFPFDQGFVERDRSVSYRFWDHNGQEPEFPVSYIGLVKHGAIVRTVGELRDPNFTLQLLLDADDVPTDLTGWQLRESAELEEKVEEAIELGCIYLKSKNEKAEAVLRYPRKLLAKRRRGAGIGAVLVLFSGAVIWLQAIPSMSLTLTPEYYLWFSKQCFVKLSPWMSAALMFRLLGTIRKEKALIAGRREALNEFSREFGRI